MAKKSLFECQACGYKSSKWLGKCTNCGSWDSFLEVKEESKSAKRRSAKNVVQPITQIKEDNVTRFSSGDSELDLVLGGGVVPSSLILIGGNPGVGKSTLLLRVASNLAQSGKRVLYVSAEESLGQIKIRANRIDANSENLYLFSELTLEAILEEMKSFDLVVIDSIQTIYSDEISSAVGSVSQVKAITFELMTFAKSHHIAIFIIGHITKDGSIAGPRVLEHMVDTVLYFEGDSSKDIRILRAFKNRFGSINEVGIFEMKSSGLASATNISSRFIKQGKKSSGSAFSVVMEGTRPIVLEIQALVSESYGNPRRSSTGFDQNRLTMLLALLERKLELPFNTYDVFINISGGIKITETSADLAVIAAIISSFRERPLSYESIFLGEVGLIGDVKEIYHLESRLKEASLQGFKKAIIPKKPSMSVDLVCYEIDEVAKLIELMWLVHFCYSIF